MSLRYCQFSLELLICWQNVHCLSVISEHHSSPLPSAVLLDRLRWTTRKVCVANPEHPALSFLLFSAVSLVMSGRMKVYSLSTLHFPYFYISALWSPLSLIPRNSETEWLLAWVCALLMHPGWPQSLVDNGLYTFRRFTLFQLFFQTDKLQILMSISISCIFHSMMQVLTFLSRLICFLMKLAIFVLELRNSAFCFISSEQNTINICT